MKRLLWLSLFVALMFCAQHAKAQPPAASIQVGSTNVTGGVPGDCLTVSTSRKLGQAPCGGGGGGTPAGSADQLQKNGGGGNFAALSNVSHVSSAGAPGTVTQTPLVPKFNTAITASSPFGFPESVICDDAYCYVGNDVSTASTVPATIFIIDRRSMAVVSSLNIVNMLAANAMVKSGNVLYIANVETSAVVSFASVDVSNPKVPALLGTISSNRDLGGVFQMVGAGNYLFAANGECMFDASTDCGITTIDVHDPSHPFVAAFKSDGTNLPDPNGITLNGGVLTVSCFSGRITTLNASNPLALSVLGSLSDATVGAVTGQSGATVFAVIGNFSSASSITAIDVSNPVTPVKLSTLDLSAISFSPGSGPLQISGNTLYIPWTDNILTAINISNPSAMTVVGSLTDATNLNGAFAIALAGTTLYAVNSNVGSGFSYPGVGIASFDITGYVMPGARIGNADIDTASVRGDARVGGTQDAQGFTAGIGGLASQGPVAGPNISLILTLFANLPTVSAGTQVYCSDCTVTSGSNNTCANSGTGSMALRLNGAWKCEQ